MVKWGNCWEKRWCLCRDHVKSHQGWACQLHAWKRVCSSAALGRLLLPEGISVYRCWWWGWEIERKEERKKRKKVDKKKKIDIDAVLFQTNQCHSPGGGGGGCKRLLQNLLEISSGLSTHTSLAQLHLHRTKNRASLVLGESKNGLGHS